MPIKPRPEFVVSGCLAGLKCRYDGNSNPCAYVEELARSGRATPVCPESLACLPRPRPPCEWRKGRVMSRDGRDLTEAFERGANLALEMALRSGARRAILKARSPSCGAGQIYDGSFTKKLVAGNGLFASKLLAAGFEVMTEEDLRKSDKTRVRDADGACDDERGS